MAVKRQLTLESFFGIATPKRQKEIPIGIATPKRRKEIPIDEPEVDIPYSPSPEYPERSAQPVEPEPEWLAIMADEWKPVFDVIRTSREWAKNWETIKHQYQTCGPNMRPCRLTDAFNPFKSGSPHLVRAFIVGEGPYPKKENAIGYAFAVPNSCYLPVSLRNIFDMGNIDSTKAPYDLRWLRDQGVMLINVMLTFNTYKKSESEKSKQARLWLPFISALVGWFSLHKTLPYLAFGAHAQRTLIKVILPGNANKMIKAPHPAARDPALLQKLRNKNYFDILNNLIREANGTPIDFHRY